uniref:Uncharacterized protein n=1 Tax=Lygus hesperus TaxID=30085 RepID=A0A0K8SGE2_LYGHE
MMFQCKMKCIPMLAPLIQILLMMMSPATFADIIDGLQRENAVFVKATVQADRQMVYTDLNNLIGAFKYEKMAFDHMLDRTSEMKMATKTACLSEAVTKILTENVDATKLVKISQNLTALNTKLYNGAYSGDEFAGYTRDILTGNDTYIMKILNESSTIAKALETAFDTNKIDANC